MSVGITEVALAAACADQLLKHVDVLFVSPTEHNMHIGPSIILINELDPAYILPKHRDTYRLTPENR
jgi:hypothetical protein